MILLLRWFLCSACYNQLSLSFLNATLDTYSSHLFSLGDALQYGAEMVFPPLLLDLLDGDVDIVVRYLHSRLVQVAGISVEEILKVFETDGRPIREPCKSGLIPSHDLFCAFIIDCK